MRILITGGAGFIGGHLARAYLDRGDDVVLLDNLSTGRISNLPDHDRARFVAGSVLDRLQVDELVKDCDAVAHLAAAVGVRTIVSEPLRSFVTNIRGSEHVLEAAHSYGKPLLLASTSEIYGKNEGLLSETSDRILGSTDVARWSYSTSKAADEFLALAYHRERGLPTVIARLFNTTGPRQLGAYGMVLPRFVALALCGEDIPVYGAGTQTRCFCDVSDVVRALLTLLDDPDGDVYNVGSSEEVSIQELAERVVAMTGSISRIRLVPYDKVYGRDYEDMLRRVPDTTKLRERTGWRPQLALDDIIRRVSDWAKEAGPDTLLGR